MCKLFTFIITHYSHSRSQNSIVVTQTTLRVEYLKNRSTFPGMHQVCIISPQRPDKLWSTTCILFNGHREALKTTGA